jgi:hypothetical protein
MARNPLYNAQWRARLEAAKAALQAIRAEETRCAAAGFGSPAHRRALAMLDEARALRTAIWRTQFETIADYAAWRFSTLEDARDAFALARDLTGFTSIEAVDEAFANAQRDARDGTLEQRFRLEVGQPAGLAAFAPGSGTISSWRRFGEIDCMVSFCLAEQNFHICLAHPWGGLAAQKSNEMFRAIATQLARETILLQAPEAEPVFADGGHRLAQNREAIRVVNALAAKFRFYRHLLPERNLREEFCAVSMVWNGSGWIDPDWEARVFDRLPESLRDAGSLPALPALSAPRVRPP